MFRILWWFRRRWGAVPVVPPVVPPSPTRLHIDLVHTALELDVTQQTGGRLAIVVRPTALEAIADDGTIMTTPIRTTAGATGPLTLRCRGVDGTAEDLAAAQSVKLTVTNKRTGAVKVNAVDLQNLSSNGTATWNRQASEVNTPGDYLAQVKVVRSDGSIGFFPDGEPGEPLTLIRATAQ